MDGKGADGGRSRERHKPLACQIYDGSTVVVRPGHPARARENRQTPQSRHISDSLGAVQKHKAVENEGGQPARLAMAGPGAGVVIEHRAVVHIMM